LELQDIDPLQQLSLEPHTQLSLKGQYQVAEVPSFCLKAFEGSVFQMDFLKLALYSKVEA